MRKIWQVMIFEYARHVFRKRFLFGLFSLPAFIGIMALVIFILVRSEFNFEPIGYVDHSGLLPSQESLADEKVKSGWIQLIAYNTEERAQEALEFEHIQAYYVLDENYLETRQVKLIALETPSSAASSQFGQFVRLNLLKNFPTEIVQRVTQGNQLVVRSVDGSRQFIEGEWLGFVLPFIVGFIFLVAVFATSGYLLQAVVEEKENLTMELLVTSISQNKLMTGKIIGIIGIGATQLIVWFGMLLLLIMIGGIFFNLPRLIQVSFEYIILAIALFVPAFVMLAALMVAVGATLTDSQEAQQVTGIFTLPLFIPFWFALVLINHPNGPLAIGLSFFPFTAPITIAIRTGFTAIPTWQIVASLGLLLLSAVLAVWFAGRALRLGMLRYGQRVAWREFLGLKPRGETR